MRIFGVDVQEKRSGSGTGPPGGRREAGLRRRAQAAAGRLAELIEEQGLTVTLAESCTGGLVGYMLTSVPGISRFFSKGFVAYSDRAKTDLLGVDPAVIAAHGAVSAETARAMALGAARASAADLAVAVTGVAGPGGGTAAKPVGLVYTAVFLRGRTEARRHEFGSPGREEVRLRSAAAALEQAIGVVIGEAPALPQIPDSPDKTTSAN